jgi:Cof subfamily protein (haloacid dehalogenase superfamily)
MTPRRIAFLDVDGTLIDHDQRLATSAVDAVRGARANGHLVYLCSGRARVEVPATVADIGFDGVISAGGGFIERDGDLVAAYTMPAPALHGLVAFFDAWNIEYILQGYDDVYPSRGLFERVRPLFEASITRAGEAAASVDMKALETRMTYHGPAPEEAIAKATFFGADRGTFARVRDGVDERFHVITGTIPYLGEAGGEVALHGVNKGAAIVELVERIGMSLADAIGIGDSRNDLEMLQVCGVGIAMGNADDTVKSYADEVTTSVHEDGVYRAFVRHGLI